MTGNKEWLFLAFHPQEESDKLDQLRGKLTPFLKAVMKALSTELENEYSNKMKESILDEIIQLIPAENSTSITVNPSSNTVDTLQLEFGGKLDKFEQTSHVLNSFVPHNSNLTAMHETQGEIFLH